MAISKSFLEYHYDKVRMENEKKSKNFNGEREVREVREVQQEEDERAPPTKRARGVEWSQEEFARYATSGLYPLENPQKTALFEGTFAEFVARNSNHPPIQPVVTLSASAPQSLEEWFARLSIV